LAILLSLQAQLSGCSDPPSAPEAPRELMPVDNPFGPDDPLWSEQPHRDRPSTMLAHPDGERIIVALTGPENDPGREVAIVDAETLATERRIEVGPGPMGLALHPDGRFLVVTNRFARYASVVDLDEGRVVAEVDVPYYTEAVAFSPDGRLAVLANRWKDSLLRWEVEVTEGRFEAKVLDPLRTSTDSVGLPVPANPRRVVFTPDGTRLLVTSETEMALTMVDVERWTAVAVYEPNSPVIDAVIADDFIYVLHVGSGSNHPPDDGFDGDHDGAPGDNTANVGFQDVQNEIDVLALSDLERMHRYTSDSICCKDYRDVDPDRPEAGEELAPVDAWPRERAAFMPARSTWTVAGAMPERAVLVRRADGGAALAVVFGGSSEVQTFDIDAASGALTPRETAETGLYATGFGAIDAVATRDGHRLVVLDRLSETLTALDLTGPTSAEAQTGVVGDVSGGEFPATDVELGEAFNTVTAAFTVDGDQTCVTCHREGTPIAKAVSMPLLETPTWGVRLIMSYRQAYDSRPWFVEAGMGEENFFPVINEFARKENFCCEQSDTRVWSLYPSRAECVDDDTLEGCEHVLECLTNPPPECAERAYGVPALTRDQHFRDAARRVLGRDESFGDALFAERVGPDGNIVRRPIRLGFDGITRALGTFLLARPRALPNPNAAFPAANVSRGAAIFASTEAGCNGCHPLPVTSTAFPTAVTDAPGPITFPYLVTPIRDPWGNDVDRVNPAFLGTFPTSRQNEGGLRIGVAQIRGAWDRTRFLHHGAARSLREVLATPGHAALRDGERALNERDGQPNTHGGISHLSVSDFDALVAFLETL